MYPILINHQYLIIYAYPLFWGLAWGIAFFYLKANIKNEDQLKMRVLFFSLFISSWLGGKLLFYLSLPKEFSAPLLDSEYFWLGGGFSFMGGLFSSLIILVLYWNKFKFFLNEHGKEFITILPLSHSIGRIGCLLAGCCYGEKCNLPWSISLHGAQRHPTQIYEFIFLLSLFIWFKLDQKSTAKNLLLNYLILYSIFRLIFDFFRADENLLPGLVLNYSQFTAILILIGSLLIKYKRRFFK